MNLATITSRAVIYIGIVFATFGPLSAQADALREIRIARFHCEMAAKEAASYAVLFERATKEVFSQHQDSESRRIAYERMRENFEQSQYQRKKNDQELVKNKTKGMNYADRLTEEADLLSWHNSLTIVYAKAHSLATNNAVLNDTFSESKYIRLLDEFCSDFFSKK